jgi:hypothetical protein
MDTVQPGANLVERGHAAGQKPRLCSRKCVFAPEADRIFQRAPLTLRNMQRRAPSRLVMTLTITQSPERCLCRIHPMNWPRNFPSISSA